MRHFAILLLFLVGLSASGQQPDVEPTIRDLYQKVLAALEVAKTEEDLRRLVEIMDVREWLSLDPTGRPMTRDQAVTTDLKSILTMPPERRLPQMEILWTNTSEAARVVVLWVYYTRELVDREGRYGASGEKHQALVGSLARDTFARTESGWRRVRHEKIIPNQVLAVDGRSVISPPLASATSLSAKRP